MSVEKIQFSKAFRISAVLLLLGLCVEAISLRWVHPIAFILFFVAGGSLIAAGVLLYLYSLVTMNHSQESQVQGPPS
jgi:hypothetical protein